MVKHCCYALCKSDSRYPAESVFFIRFPKPWIDLAKCKRWILCCKRKDFGVKNITNSTYICSLHFVGGNGPTVENPDPDSRAHSTAKASLKRRSTATSDPTCSKRERSESLDIILDEKVGSTEVLGKEVKTNDEVAQVLEADKVVEKYVIPEVAPDSLQPIDIQDLLQNPNIETIVIQSNVGDDDADDSDNNKNDQSTQTGIEVENPFIKKLQKELENLKENLIVAAARFASIATDDKKFKFYTGLSLQQFEVLWDFLDENKNCLKVWTGKDSNRRVSYLKNQLSPKDQLLICLMRIRCGFLEQDLAYRFNVSQGWVSKVIITWIQYLYQYFKQLDCFPSKGRIQRNPQPKVFRRFKNLRVILDGFEVNTQKPSDYRQQGNMYSNYKAHSTFKFLLGIIPTGGICFVSEAFEGSISDREIFVKSGLFDKLEYEDAIMVDKGFNVQDICNEKSVKVYIPPFLKDRAQLTKEEVQLTKNIASARIHVERCVGAMKQFRLLQKILPKNLIPIISQTVFVISCLVNLREPLVS